MESISLNHVFFATNRKNPLKNLHRRRRFCRRIGRLRFGVTCSKLYDFQDFQGYVKPLRLLPAQDFKVCQGKPLVEVGGSRSLYKVKLQTSPVFGSSLSDLNSRVLLCLIDEKGNSMLYTIPAYMTNKHSPEPEGIGDHESLGFQRGSTDEVVFEGTKLGKIKALWISLESGQWRLGGVSLFVIDSYTPSPGENNRENPEFVGFQYDFEAEDILLGEGSGISMVELRPILVTKQCGVDPFALLNNSSGESTSNFDPQISKEESMKEYTDLKFSLLLYDAIFTFLGTSVLSVSLGKSSAIAFFVGGVSGFLYLLLLQRSVDGLQGPGSLTENSEGNSDQISGGIKVPLFTLALAIGFSALAVKSDIGGDFLSALTPKEIVAGMIGFLACKLSVIVAAFKPLSVGLKEDE